jgi:hypothetical protein
VTLVGVWSAQALRHWKLPEFDSPHSYIIQLIGRSALFTGGFAFMRFKSGISAVAWSAFSFTAVALATLCAGCDSGTTPATPEAKQAAEAQKEQMTKIEEQNNAAASKKGGAVGKIGRKPGAVGGN